MSTAILPGSIPAAISNNSLKLSAIQPGSSARVVGVSGGGPVSRRLLEMGVVPGVTLRVVKTAPFGDPFEVRLLGYSMALRKSEADLVEVIV